MFDFSWTEIALFAVVVLIFIKPKDLPVAMRALSRAIKAIRRMAGEFQKHIDDMVREADLSEAREQIKELRQFNIRDQVKKAIDPDGSLKESLTFDEQDSSNHFDSNLPSVPPPPVSESEDHNRGENQPYNARIQLKAEALKNAPAIIPPPTAMRLVDEAEYWHPPAFIPPEIALHHGRRIRILSDPSSEKADKRQHV